MRAPYRVLLLCVLLLGSHVMSAMGAVSREDVQVPTRQGHPQMVISPARRQDVSDAIVKRLGAQGWLVTKTTPYSVEAEKPAKGMAAFLGSVLSVNKYVTDPVYRLNFGLSDSGDNGVLVSGAQALIQNPHTGTESPVRLDNKKQEAPLWDLLQSLKNEVESKAADEQQRARDESVTPEFPPGFVWPNQPSASQAVRDTVYGLRSFYDRFDDMRHMATDTAAVTVSNPSTSGSLFLMGHVQCRGDSLGPLLRSELQLVSTGPVAEAARGATSLVVLAGDHRLVFDALQQRDLDGGIHIVLLPVTSDTLLMISEAATVEGRLGGAEFKLSPRGQENLRNLGRLLSSEAARPKASTRRPARARTTSVR